ncbi:hypothetical protein GQR58_011826 [Nymphon striatum]|nr:hypothetical protein GQR58_011826 [Nymphon striatum]
MQLEYEMSKQQRKLHALKNLVQTERDSLENFKSVSGHYSTRNVNKRDENARNTGKKLRELKTSFGKQTRELDSLRTENEELRKKLKEIDIQKLKEANGNKTKAQKLASHYRNLVKKGANNIRLCVMELFALEIGMEKITSAIETVGKHMFEYKFQQKDLPTLTTVRNIVDEGHYLAKSYIAKKIENAENIGISRDETTRKKREKMSLRFTKVARETVEVINTVTKTQFTELAETVVNETVTKVN